MSTSSKTIRIYFRENMRYPGLFGGTLFLWLCGMLLQKLLLPLLIAQAFNRIVSAPNAAALSWSSFSTIGILFVLIAGTAQVAIDCALLLLSRLETKVTPALNQKIYNLLINQSMSFHANRFSGALVTQTNRFTSAYVTLTDALVVNISQMFVLVVLSSAVVLFYAPLIAVTIFVWSLIFGYANFVLTRKRIQFSKAASEADTVLTAHLADTISNVQAVKTFAHEEAESATYTHLAKDRATKKYIFWMRAIKNDIAFGLMMGTLQILVLAVSIYSVQRNAISIGTLVLAQVYITQIISSLWGLSGLMRNIEQNLADAAEMTEILGQDIEVIDKPDAATLQASKGALKFSNVHFTHTDNKEHLFAELNLSIRGGEKVGLVGPSGGGKTTITKLLLRFMDIQQGQILVDGQDIADVTQASLRSSIAYVPQEPILFHRSLAENISYGKPDATSVQVHKAAKLSHAHEFIQQLPKGYDTLVGERGVKLSGGQRQRVAIARAMLKDAPILVLDEATSALDSESEVLIQDALWKLMEGRTAIVIAHRLSTIQKMDRIVVLDKGQIVEEGTHKELIRRKGVYASLWAHQSGGFIEE
jgi:ATP-binding cassette subfamily B protein